MQMGTAKYAKYAKKLGYKYADENREIREICEKNANANTRDENREIRDKKCECYKF